MVQYVLRHRCIPSEGGLIIILHLAPETVDSWDDRQVGSNLVVAAYRESRQMKEEMDGCTMKMPSPTGNWANVPDFDR